MYASFSNNQLVPQDVVFRQFANVGGAVVSWTVACYILTTAFAEQLRADEDMMPLDGNPHPMPGELQQPENFWALRPYPALGWNDVPPPPPVNDPVQPEAREGWGQQWVVHDDEPEDPVEQPAQDQLSMILNPSLGSDSSSQHAQVAPNENLVLQGQQVDGPVLQNHEEPANEVVGPMMDQPAQ